MTQSTCEREDLVYAYALCALSAEEMRVMKTHIALCAACREEAESLRPIVAILAHWSTDVLRPTPQLWEKLAQRIAVETGDGSAAAPARRGPEPVWEEVAPGISCKLLATDKERDRVSMLVRLAPGVPYPHHVHAGVEELHLLAGELWIEDRKLVPGDYNRAEPGTADQRVWSEMGCTCLLITSPSDLLITDRSAPAA